MSSFPVRASEAIASSVAGIPNATEIDNLVLVDGQLVYQAGIASGIAGPPDAPSDGGTYARKDGEWIDIEGAANLQVRRGTAAEVAEITPLDGEPVWATDSRALSVGDGVTEGGVFIGTAPVVSGGPTDQILGESFVSLSSATLSPAGSVWRISNHKRISADPLFASSAEIKIGGGIASTAILSGSYRVLLDGTGLVDTGAFLDTAETLEVSGDGGEVWHVFSELIVSVSAASVAFSQGVKSTTESDSSVDLDLTVAERLA
jgi:hypothetical protein